MINIIKKMSAIALIVGVMGILMPLSATAADDSKEFTFDLSTDGKDIVEVDTGDVITVVLKLQRKDISEPYYMYAMQDEIHYDSAFFEFVEGSSVLYEGVATTDIAMVDQYREFYMNYLSMSGGTQWDYETVVGSIQLKVIGKAGVSQITNQDYLVSLEDGSDSYKCNANDLTVVLSTDCTVKFDTNGGTKIENQIVQYGEKIEQPDDPNRDGFGFEGWYSDIHLTEKWDFADDVEGNMTLYAKWGEEKNVCNIWWIILLILLLILVIIVKKIKDRKHSRGVKEDN